MDLTIRPQSSQWRELIERRPTGLFHGKSSGEWRTQTRAELGLATDRPVIATGHQTLLWHPGILAKYLAADACAAANNLATANLVVDQHIGEFGSFEIPVRKHDGSLGVRKIELCAPSSDVPMGRHTAFTPPPLSSESLTGAIPSVNEGVQRIFDAVHAHRDAPNAAIQMSAAIAHLMRWGGWASAMPDVTATNLIGTSLAKAMMREMIADARRCAECYNRAVQSLPEAGIGGLMIRDDYVELPLWRIRDDGRRARAYDSDVENAISAPRPAVGGNSQPSIVNRQSSIDVLPRALFMTALVRLGMCDLFIHGTGGANYDRAMELWIKDWLGLDVGSIAVVSADVRLPLMPDEQEQPDVRRSIEAARRAWHDPESVHGAPSPGSQKRRLLKSIEESPRNSSVRRSAFLKMHEELGNARTAVASQIEQTRLRAELAKRQASDFAVANRRDWAFPLYPRELMDELAAQTRDAAAVGGVINPAFARSSASASR